MADAALTIRLLGGFDLRSGDGPVPPLGSARAESLLAFLLLHRDRPQPRQRVAFLLWPDSTEPQARTNLRHVVHNLRRALPWLDRFLDVTSRTLQWRADAPFWLDVAAFEGALSIASDGPEGRIAALERAVETYCGDLMAGRDDDWIIEERDRLRGRYLEALGEMLKLLTARGDIARAVLCAERLLRAEPLRESTYLLLMRLHEERGDRARALRVYHQCATTLERELGVEPGSAVRAAYDALLPPEHQPDTGARRLGGPPLVGRSAERARLTALWREAQAGIGPRLVLVRGEAGVGKSRLVEELEAWCAHRGMVTAHARSYAAEGSLAFGPVVTWLRSAVIRPRLAGADLEDLSELGRLMPELASGQPALSRPALPDTDHRQLFDAVARVLLGPGIPLMLVLDDIQWADRETLRLVHFLIRQDPPAPLLVVAAVRSEDADDAQFSGLTTGLRALGRTVEIDLGRLSREETALLAERLSGRRLTESEVDALQSQTEGNPLFVVEAMRAGWRPGATWLTPKVQAAVESRLSQLSGPTRDLVGVAATIGREFTWPVLAAASRADEDVLVISLDELWQRRIIVDHGADAYDFSHDKIREVAYLGLRPAQRRHHHLRVAQALAQVHQDDPGRVSGQLAVHCESAGDIRAAITWYARAAEVAQQVNAHEEAVRLLDRALALLPRLQGDEERGARELEVSTALLAPLAIVEGYCSRRLLATQEAVFALSRRLGVDPAPELLRSAALARLSTNDLATAQQHGDQLLTTGVRLHDGVLIAEGHYVLGICGFWQADFEAARTHFEAAVEHYRPEHRDVHLVRYGTDPKVVCLSRLANTLWFLGQPEEAVRARDAALAYAEEIDHPGSVGTALVFAAALALDMGDLSRFRSYAAALDADARRQPKVNRLAAELFAGLLDVLDGRAQPGWARIDRLQRETDSGAFAPGSRALVARVVLEAARATGDTSRVIEAADRLLTVGGGEVWAETARRVRDGSPARGG